MIPELTNGTLNTKGKLLSGDFRPRDRQAAEERRLSKRDCPAFPRTGVHETADGD